MLIKVELELKDHQIESLMAGITMACTKEIMATMGNDIRRIMKKQIQDNVSAVLKAIVPV